MKLIFCGYCETLKLFEVPATVTSIGCIGTENLEICFEPSSTNINFTNPCILKTIVLTRPFGEGTYTSLPINLTQNAYIINPNSTNVTIGSTTYNDNTINVFNQTLTETEWWKTFM